MVVDLCGLCWQNPGGQGLRCLKDWKKGFFLRFYNKIRTYVCGELVLNKC